MNRAILMAAAILSGVSIAGTASAAEGRGRHAPTVTQVELDRASVEHSQLGHDRRDRRRGDDCDRRRDRGCEKPSYRRGGHSRGKNFIYVRPGRSYIIIRGGDSCEPRRRDHCR
ncbi:MAG TPA: hypothetical protein VHN77_08905 [Phycisphaerales bacterium]|nr:hypothetical protein [Phycisphaerales bacterium]